MNNENTPNPEDMLFLLGPFHELNQQTGERLLRLSKPLKIVMVSTLIFLYYDYALYAFLTITQPGWGNAIFCVVALWLIYWCNTNLRLMAESDIRLRNSIIELDQARDRAVDELIAGTEDEEMKALFLALKTDHKGQ